MGLGFMFMDGGHPKEAAELITDAIKNRFPESIQLYRVLGRAYQKMGDKKNTIAAYKKMILKAKQQKNPQLDSFENLLEQVKKKM
jgi:predicted Zn-dependent protease